VLGVRPAAQFCYVAMELPAIAGYPILAAALALPLPLMTPVVSGGRELP
jgi:hypothetical protein